MDKKTVLRKTISDALEQLLENVDSIQDISVQDILDRCGLSRPTFYRYFSDKYDVVNWTYSYYVEELTGLYGDSPSVVSPDARFRQFIQFFYDRRSFFYKVMDYTGQNSFFEHYFSCFVRWYRTTCYPSVQMVDPLPVEEHYMLLYTAAGVTQILREWLAGGCRESPEQICEIIDHNLPPNIPRHIL